MTGKKLIVTGIVTAGVLAGIAACITMTGREESVETVAEVSTADEPEVEAETEEAETVQEEEEGLASLPKETADETETDEESLQDSEEEEETEEEAIDDLDTMMYATTNVNLRSGTAVTTESLRLVGFAEEVKVTGITVNKQWYRVQDGDNVGFIASGYLSDTKPEQNTSSQQSTSSQSSDTQTTQSTQQTPSGVDQSTYNKELEQLKNELSNLQGGFVQTGENAGYMSDAGGRTLNN